MLAVLAARPQCRASRAAGAGAERHLDSSFSVCSNAETPQPANHAPPVKSTVAVDVPVLLIREESCMGIVSTEMTLVSAEKQRRKLDPSWPLLAGGALAMLFGYLLSICLTSIPGFVSGVCLVVLGLGASILGVVLYRREEIRFWRESAQRARTLGILA